MRRLERERAPVFGDGLAVALQRHERQSAVVVVLGLVGCERDRAIEQRHRVGGAVALVEHDAQVVERARVVGRQAQRRAVVPFGGVEVVALVGFEAAPREDVRRDRVGFRGGRRGRERAVALLVAQAAAAGARVVAADGRGL